MLRRAEGILLRLTTVHYRQSESQKHQLGFWKNSCTLGPMPRTGRIYLSQSVSFPPELLAAAKRRAANLGLSFSTYVQKCIERDLPSARRSSSTRRRPPGSSPRIPLRTRPGAGGRADPGPAARFTSHVPPQTAPVRPSGGSRTPDRWRRRRRPGSRQPGYRTPGRRHDLPDDARREDRPHRRGRQHVHPGGALGRISKLKMSDGPVAVRTWGPTTAYAGGIALAAAWDPGLARRMGESMGEDARARGVNFLLGPGLDIYRAPMNGRTSSTSGRTPTSPPGRRSPTSRASRARASRQRSSTTPRTTRNTTGTT